MTPCRGGKRTTSASVGGGALALPMLEIPATLIQPVVIFENQCNCGGPTTVSGKRQRESAFSRTHRVAMLNEDEKTTANRWSREDKVLSREADSKEKREAGKPERLLSILHSLRDSFASRYRLGGFLHSPVVTKCYMYILLPVRSALLQAF